MNNETQTFQYCNEYDRLVNDFISYSIPFDKPGFYNHPNFIAQEKQNPKFLEEYARFVRDQPYKEEYLEHARKEIPRICMMLHNELVMDGSKGKCSLITSLLCNILEREGFWNYGVKGALTISIPNKQLNTYFRPNGIDGGHAWVVAPPFTILDLSVNQQYYENGESSYLPDYIISESQKTSDVFVDDILSKGSFKCNPLVRIADISPEISRFLDNFNPRQIDHKGTSLKYSGVAILMIEGELADIPYIFNGRYLKDVYDEVIKGNRRNCVIKAQ